MHFVLQVFLLAAFGSNSADAATCFAAASGFSTEDWHCRDLSPTMALYYKVHTEEQRLYLGVHAQDHDGWVGIGINGNGGMKGGSFVTVRLEDDAWIAEDRFALDYGMPSLDDKQDVELVDARRSGSDIMWSVKLPLNSCDEHDYQIKDITQRVLWAKGSSHSFSYHGNQVGVDRGSTEVNFYRELTQVADPADAFTIDFRMPNINVKVAKDGSSPARTSVCAAFNLEQLGVAEGTFHITKLSAIVSPAASKYVQQVFLNPCLSAETPEYVQDASASPSSWVEMDCKDMLQCKSQSAPHFAWAAGAGDLAFPDEAGYEISTTDVKYFVMKVHYYNPAQDIDAIDNSGIRVTATRTLRPNKIGIMMLNRGPWRFRPLQPEVERIKHFLQVPTACLNESWPAEVQEVTLLNVYHHQHLRGTEIQIRVISSDGQDRGLVRTEKRYDFNHQRIAPSELTKLDRTDQILMTCEYDMSSETDPVERGDDIQTNEMCVSQLYYYPASTTSLFALTLPPIPHADTDNVSVTWCPSGAVASNTFEFSPKECVSSRNDSESPALMTASTTTPMLMPPSSSVADSADRIGISSFAFWPPLPLAMISCLLFLLS